MIFQLFCCLLVMIMHGVCQINIAKFQPSWQSSNHVPISGHASCANDGNRNGDFFDGMSCTETEDGNDQWWIVNLGAQLMVQRVVLVNRADCCGNRLRNFAIHVATSMSSPTDMSNFKLCHHFPGTAGAGAILQLACTAPQTGRYVKVQILGFGRLTLCEAEVYSCPKTGLFYEGSDAKVQTAAQSIFVTGGKQHCAVYCIGFPDCSAFSLKKITDHSYECQITNGTMNTVVASGWSHFSPCRF